MGRGAEWEGMGLLCALTMNERAAEGGENGRFVLGKKECEWKGRQGLGPLGSLGRGGGREAENGAGEGRPETVPSLTLSLPFDFHFPSNPSPPLPSPLIPSLWPDLVQPISIQRAARNRQERGSKAT